MAFGVKAQSRRRACGVQYGLAERIGDYLCFLLDTPPGYIEAELRRAEWSPGVIGEPPNVQFARHCVRLLGSLAKANARGRMTAAQEARYAEAVARFRPLWPLPGGPRARPELLTDLGVVGPAEGAAVPTGAPRRAPTD